MSTDMGMPTDTEWAMCVERLGAGGIQDPYPRVVGSEDAELASAIGELEEMAAGVARMLAALVESLDPPTAAHLERVSRDGLRLARAIDPDLAASPARFGFLLHDIGKVGVPGWILNKPGPLTSEEWKQIRRHPTVGASLLAHVPAFEEAALLVRAHHERWDGGGYPDGLRGEQIPLSARVFAVVDAYDAMVHDRPYRPARSRARALEEIWDAAGTQFDPGVAGIFIEMAAGRE